MCTVEFENVAKHATARANRGRGDVRSLDTEQLSEPEIRMEKEWFGSDGRL